MIDFSSLNKEMVLEDLDNYQDIDERVIDIPEDLKNNDKFRWDIKQGSEEWLRFKDEKVSASSIKSILASGLNKNNSLSAGSVKVSKFFPGFGTISGVLSKGAISFCNELIIQAITEKQGGGFKSKSMQRGNDLEPFAKIEHEKRKNVEVAEVGFIQSSFNDDIGFSPDGLVFNPERYVLELKCPEAKNHFKYYLDPSSLKKDYYEQVQHQLLVAKDYGFEYAILASYNPDFKNEKLRYVEIRIDHDPIIQKAIMDKLSLVFIYVKARLKEIL